VFGVAASSGLLRDTWRCQLGAGWR
jgi:hypothetical protein